ncbi:MAG: hypothetical protein IJB96_12750 [Lachnospira sp.]|nr:hypothetical protein [Lachnospira sp.]
MAYYDSNGVLQIDPLEVEMGRKVLEFNKLQNDYYMNRVSEEEIAINTTQNQYEDMVLSKKRLEEHNLCKEIFLQSKFRSYVPVQIRKDGDNLVGTARYNVKAVRNYYLGDKRIYSEKTKEICNTNFLKYNIQYGYAKCPRCGNIAKIETYTDGCDYCGAAFSVRGLVPKIASFILEENGAEKKVGLFSKLAIGFILAIPLSFAALIVSAVCASVFEPLAWLSDICMIIFSLLFVNLELIGFLFIVAIIGLVISTVVVSKSNKSPFYNTDIIKKYIPYISMQELIQGIESKVSHIYLTDKPENTAAYVKAYINSFIEEHSDVVDMCISRITFTDCKERKGLYRLELEVIVKLYRMKKGRIRTEYECVNLVLEGKKGVVDVNNYKPIRSYKCTGCGDNINITAGGVCHNCGKPYQYEDYDWVITVLSKRN